ncbi:hypothetical protein NL676_012593 [Syzygium grande]|nr:hypothetical protein NL676_012593 [Syzygium grande]
MEMDPPSDATPKYHSPPSPALCGLAVLESWQATKSNLNFDFVRQIWSKNLTEKLNNIHTSSVTLKKMTLSGTRQESVNNSSIQ